MTASGGTSPAASLGYKPFEGAAFAEVIAGRRVLIVGDRGPHVKVLEEALVAAGHALQGGAPPDIHFTRATQGSLLRFQKEKGLPQTGSLDRATLAALDRALAARQGGGAAGAAPGKIETTKLMKELLNEAMSPASGGGSRITREELERALDALTLDDGKISPEEYVAAKQALESDVFRRAATAEARTFAQEFLEKRAPSGGALSVHAVRRLDAAARDAALGRNPFTCEINLAEGTLGAAPGEKPRLDEDALRDICRRAFGRLGGSGFELAAFEAKDSGEVERLLALGVDGHEPTGPELAQVMAKLRAHCGAGPGGRLLAADWSTRGEQGAYVVAVHADGKSLLVLDVFRGGS